MNKFSHLEVHLARCAINQLFGVLLCFWPLWFKMMNLTFSPLYAACVYVASLISGYQNNDFLITSGDAY